MTAALAVYRLNVLRYIDLRTAGLLREASSLVEDEGLRRELDDFAEDHARHARLLERLVGDIGGDCAPPSRDLKRLIDARGRTVRRGDVDELIGVLVRIEARNAEHYEDAIADTLPEEVSCLLKTLLADEVRHHSYLEGLVCVAAEAGGVKAGWPVEA